MISVDLQNMERYKHYSFDLWCTLIRSNPESKRLVCEYIYNTYASSTHTLQFVCDAIRDVDLRCTRYCEISGMHVDSSMMIFMIFEKIGWCPSCADIQNVQDKYNSFFLENMPYLYDNHTKHVLNILFERGAALNILSNTGFISGDILNKVLKKLEILDYFDDTMYSDFYKIAKPNPEFFQKMVKYAIEFHPNELMMVKRSDILHVGDNPIADGGSEAVGIKFFQINTNDKTILDLL